MVGPPTHRQLIEDKARGRELRSTAALPFFPTFAVLMHKLLARWLLSALTSALCIGCAPLQTTGPLPELPELTRYDGVDEASGSMPLAWRAYFADPALQSWIAQALAHNRDRRLAAARLAQARAEARLQQAARWPVLALQAQDQRSRIPADLNLTGKPLVSSQVQFGLGISDWEIDFWGRLDSLDEAARLAWLATDAAGRALSLSLIAQVAQTWFTLAELEERLGLARQALASRDESLRIFTRRVAVGATARLALTQVQVLQYQAQTLVAQLEQARAAQWQQLTLLAGRDGMRTTPVLNELPPLQPGLPVELLTHRPDVIAAEMQLRASSASVAAARAALWPRVTLTGLLGTASAGLSGLFDGGSGAWTLAPSLALPLLDGGRLRSGLAVQQAREQQALAGYERTVQGALREVNDALGGRRWLGEQLAIARGALAAQTERAGLAQRRYEQGSAAFLEVLDAQRDLLAAQQQVVQTRSALLMAQVNLYAALGGGAMADLAFQGEGNR